MSGERTVDSHGPSDRTTALMGLIQRIKQGDQQAVNELIALAYNRIRKVSAKILHSSSFDAVTPKLYQTEDVAQEASVRLIARLRKVPVEDVDHLFGLTGMIVRRYLLDLVRRGSIANLNSQDQAGLVAPDGGGTSSFEGAQKMVAVLEGIEALPEKLRQVADRILTLGLSQDEIAEQMGVKRETIKRQWQRARIRLAQALRPNSTGPEAGPTGTP